MHTQKSLLDRSFGHLKHVQVERLGKNTITVKPALRGHSTIDKTTVFKINGSLMKVESIAGITVIIYSQISLCNYLLPDITVITYSQISH